MLVRMIGVPSLWAPPNTPFHRNKNIRTTPTTNTANTVDGSWHPIPPPHTTKECHACRSTPNLMLNTSPHLHELIALAYHTYILPRGSLLPNPQHKVKQNTHGRSVASRPCSPHKKLCLVQYKTLYKYKLNYPFSAYMLVAGCT